MNARKLAIFTLLVTVIFLLATDALGGELKQDDEIKQLKAKVKMLESSLKSKNQQIQKLKAENGRLAKEAQRLRKLCRSAGVDPSIPHIKPAKAYGGQRPALGYVIVNKKDTVIWQGTLAGLIKQCKADYKKANQINFEKRWYGATVIITGKVNAVTKSVGLHVELTAGRKVIWCSFPKAAKDILAKLRKGEVITITGSFAPPPAYQMGLSGCAIVAGSATK